MPDYRSQEATNQTIFREMNEWTADGRAGVDGEPSRLDTYLCECSDGGCTSPIRLTHREYEAIRSEPVRFAIVVDHENPELDRVHAENARFATVDKVYGPAVLIARATDPRR